MDREQEGLQFLGFFGVCSESIKIIFSCRKIFLKITLPLILPLSLLFISNIVLSILLLRKIDLEERTFSNRTIAYENIYDVLASKWPIYLIIKAIYLVFHLIFSLLPTSAVVYVVACAYSDKQITYKRIMSAIPKVWMRLIGTFLHFSFLVNTYNIVFTFVTIFIVNLAVFLHGGDRYRGVRVILILFVVFYLIGLIYISVIWQLTSVVSVLEEIYGFKAMVKSKALIKGKTGISVAMLVMVILCLGLIQFMFEEFVVGDESIGIIGKVGLVGVCLVLLSIVFLFGLVAQTVIYFVCKSYHHENIDKSSLSDHLEVYLRDYVPLTDKDIQMEEIEVKPSV